MKRIYSVTTLFIFGAAVALAQEPPPLPIAEVGLNFTAVHTMPGGGAPGFTLSGGSGTFVYNFNQIFSAVADLGGYHNPGDTNFNPTTFTYLFGPRLSLRRFRVTPYVQTLFGGARLSTAFTDPTSGIASVPKDGFAAAFGGGLDVKVGKHFLLKPGQVEYMVTRVANPWSVTPSQNNIRYTAGAVFTFGSK